MIVKDTLLLQLRNQLLGRRPRRRRVTQRLLATEPRQDIDRPREYGKLLLGRELRDKLMGVPMKSNLVSGISDFRQLLRKRLDAVSRCEESRLDAVLVVELQQAIDAYSRSVDAPRDVGWVLRRAVGGVDPVRNRVDVDWDLRSMSEYEDFHS